MILSYAIFLVMQTDKHSSMFILYVKQGWLTLRNNSIKPVQSYGTLCTATISYIFDDTPLWISIIKWQHLQLVKLQNIKVISLKQNKQILVTFFGYNDDAKVEKKLCVFEYMFNHARICTRREHIKRTGFTRN